MIHTCKSLNKLLLIICLVSIGFSDNNSTLLDSLSIALHKDGGKLIEATIEQIQVDNEWTDYVTVEIVDSNKFIFIGTEQIIKVDSDTIYTFTQNTNQLVIDHYFRNEFNMLSLLSGNFNQIKLGDIQKRLRDTIINFTIPQIESRGKIWINSKTYYPIRMILEDDLGNHTTITIDSIKPLDFQNQYRDYNSDGWEIIDLRE
jgi:outer membrane lipoprotein-sorting protein